MQCLLDSTFLVMSTILLLYHHISWIVPVSELGSVHMLDLGLMYNKPLLRGHAASSSIHQVQGRKKRGRKEEERQGEGGAHMIHGRGVMTVRSM